MSDARSEGVVSGWIFLSGLTGSGKSTLGKVLASRLQRPFVDLDQEIERQQGRSIAEIFRSEGEAAFRRMESEGLRALVECGGLPGVLALGGGTLTHPESRRLALRRGIVVTLEAPVEEVAQRLQGSETRPLLEGLDPDARRERLLKLWQERRAAYAECHIRLSTQGRSPEQGAEALVDLLGRVPVVVPLGERTYPVWVGAALRKTLLPQLEEGGRPSSLLCVSDSHVDASWSSFRQELAAAFRPFHSLILPPGEESKHLGSLAAIWDAALDAGCDRQSCLLALGGGVIGDLAGFAASTLLRGVDFVQMPTTLLAMVDSSVGGKTGIDRPQGKNLVGAFHQPRFVICDLDFLATLPLRERRAGLAEVVKSAWLEGEEAVAALERDAEALARGETEATERAIRMAIGLKARIVGEDEHESGPRRLLNFGHTLGHAIEAAEGYGRLRHGEAVALGMVAALEIAARHFGDAPASVQRMRALLRRLGLEAEPRAYLRDETWTFLSSDKKKRGNRVHWVLPREPGDQSIVALELSEARALLGAG